MAQVEEWWGLDGVVWLAGVIMLVYAVTVLRACRSQSSLLVSATLTILVLAASTPSLSARPQVLSFVLTAVTVSAWIRTTEDGRARWWLIPLTWLWVLLHGMWLVGISISLVAAVGHVLDGRATWRSRAHVLGVPLGSALAAALTPVGPGIYEAVLLVGSRANYFDEWDPPSLTDLPTMMMMILLMGALLMRLRQGVGLWATDLILLLGLVWGMYSGRTVPVAAVIAAVLLARYLRPFTPFRSSSRRELATLLSAGLCAAAALGVATANQSSDVGRPPWLDARLNSLPEGTPVFSDLQFGGYLMWRYPEVNTLAHGYADMYTTHELDDIILVSNVEAGWDQTLRDLDAEYVLMAPDAALTYALINSAGWRVLEKSDRVLLLAPPWDWQIGNS